MKTRQEAEELISVQLGWEGKDPTYHHKDNKKWYDIELKTSDKKDTTLWHYGRCELKELLDFIYGETPLQE